MTYDRADWHSGGEFPSDLPPECGGTHIGIFLAWAIMNGLEGALHREDSQGELRLVRERRMTGRDFLFRACDGKFWDEDLNEEGNAFAQQYYSREGGGYGPYLQDYEATIAKGLPSTYHVADSWEVYDRIAEVIDRRYAQWRSSRA
jgi:hypothetical protein